MDRKKLLEEYAKLKCILSNYENNQTLSKTTDAVKLNENKIKNCQIREIHKSSIFLNKKKLNNVHNKITLKAPAKVSNNDTFKMTAKVFINPNFRKPDSTSFTAIGIKEVPKPSQNLLKDEKLRSNNATNNLLQKSNSIQKQISKPVSSRKPTVTSISNRGTTKLHADEKKSSNFKSHHIFVNPEFSSKSNLETGYLNSSSQVERRKNISAEYKFYDQNLVSGTEKSEQKLPIIMHRKRKVCLNMDKPLSNDQKRRKSTENINLTVKRIFVNPQFDRKVNDRKSCETPNIGDKTTEIKVNTNVFPSSSSNPQTLSVQDNSKNISLFLDGKEVPSKYTSLSYPLCAIVGPERGKQLLKKSASQRIRMRRSSLSTMSATKPVRKRKLSLKVTDSTTKITTQPIFVSKTKLVQNVAKKSLNNSCLTQVKIKQLTPKSQQCVTSEKHKWRRKSFTDNTVILKMQRPAVVTKIRSKNGKSLQLIRKVPETPFSQREEKVKTQNIVNNRKTELRQQASKIAMCLFQSHLRRNQFSKINVPVKISDSRGYTKNEYPYKKNNVISRKPLTKAALIGKSETVNFQTKSQYRNALDKTKFIKSKYRLIRKHTMNNGRYKCGQKIGGRVTTRDKLLQRKKLKWRSKCESPRRRLTRKDLSIKKIGGVFYRCSRTSLAKNTEPVSQFRAKGISQVLSERRQSRFCLDKYPRKKRTSLSGVSFVTSPSGMSWRRTSHGSARSILTQAKQKSVQLLTKKMKKNNEPCLFFHRYGRCSGQERGNCVRLHDRKYVAVCKRFIQGACTDAECLLSHAPSCHNMPTCHHFLAGQCGRDNCPYPHIKVSDTAPVCLHFLKGYCPLGEECSKRHFEICPSFEKGICARGKYCPYPHPKSKTGDKLKGKFKHIKRKVQPPRETETVSTPNLRYFEDVNLQNTIKLDQDSKGSEDSEEEETEVTCLKKRPQLGELPSFIPLNQSLQEKDS